MGGGGGGGGDVRDTDRQSSYFLLMGKGLRFKKLGLLISFAGGRELYPYTSHLLTLESRRPTAREMVVPEQWRSVRTPLQPGEWGKCLARHPDEEYQAYLMRGMQEGFRVGFKYGKNQCQSVKAMLFRFSGKPVNEAELRD